MTKWTRVTTDPSTKPTVPGVYRVMIAGDSESVDGHTIYDFPDYETFGTLHPAEDDGDGMYQPMTFMHDEEIDHMIAWFGPLEIPPCDCFGGTKSGL